MNILAPVVKSVPKSLDIYSNQNLSKGDVIISSVKIHLIRESNIQSNEKTDRAFIRTNFIFRFKLD